MTTLTGGKNVYGASIGILMLQTRFPRIPGDIGNAESWPFPVQYRVVPGATPDRVVGGDPRRLLGEFVREGQALVAMGCDIITTNCGFLVLLQEELRAALGVPVATSSLMQVPMVEALLPPGQRAGVLTISRKSLTPAHFRAAGMAPDTPVEGTDAGCEFSRVILNDETRMDVELARQDHLEAADRLLSRHPEVGAIVLECTNMVPFAADIRRHTGLPVWSVFSLVGWLQAGTRPSRFAIRLDDPRV